MAPPPVASTKSHWRMSSFVDSRLGVSMPITKSSGAPIFLSAARMRSQIFLLVSFALGCGATMMEFLPFTAWMPLITGVASGLVDGASAPITPSGLASTRMFRSGYSSITPTDLSWIISSSVARVLRCIFRNLPS